MGKDEEINELFSIILNLKNRDFKDCKRAYEELGNKVDNLADYTKMKKYWFKESKGDRRSRLGLDDTVKIAFDKIDNRIGVDSNDSLFQDEDLELRNGFRIIKEREEIRNKLSELQEIIKYFRKDSPKWEVELEKLMKEPFFTKIDGKRWILEVYQEYYWKRSSFFIEFDQSKAEWEEKTGDTKIKLPESEIEKLSGYSDAFEIKYIFDEIDRLLEKILNLTTNAIIYDRIVNEVSRSQKLPLLESFMEDFGRNKIEMMLEQLKNIIAYPFYYDLDRRIFTRKNQRLPELLHSYHPDLWYTFYLAIREKKKLQTTHSVNRKMKVLTRTTPEKQYEPFQEWLWNLCQPYYKELLKQFPDKNPERKIEQKEVIELIKELLLELKEGDEVQLTKAMEIIRKEGEFSFITDSFIEESLKQVAKKSPVFEYVRLKECIRIKSSPVESLNIELDKIFDEWLSDIEEGKDLCMICMRPVTGEKVIGTCVYCGNKAHLNHLKEWVKQKAVCPVCKKTLKQEDIIEISPKNSI